MVIVTAEKIEVSLAMMEQANMTRGSQLGVPVDPATPARGLRWKEWHEMSSSDFDAIEDYFLSKEANQIIMANSFTDYQLEQFAEQLQDYATTNTHGSFSDKEIAKEQLLTLAEGNMKRLVTELQGLRELFQAATTPDPQKDTPLVGDSGLFWRRASRNATETSDALFCLGEAYNHVVNQLYGQRDSYEKRVQVLAAELAAHKQTAYPETLTPHLAVVLGWPNFKCGKLALVFRRAGYDIPHKAEREQAFILHWATKLVLKHGVKWAEVGDEELKAMQKSQRAAVGGIIGLLQNGIRRP